MKQIFVATWGNDANDGRSWATAKLTQAAGHALLTSGLGDLYFGPGIFSIPDTVTLSQGQHWHGHRWEDEAGFGTELQWSGADDGRAMLSFSGSVASSKQLFEDFRIKGTVGMVGGGSCLSLRNLQNGSIIRNIHVGPWGAGPSFRIFDSIAGSVDYPGYAILENCWASSRSPYGFQVESGTTGILLDRCASDSLAGQLAAFYFPMKTKAVYSITACSQSGNNATFTAAGHGLSAGSFAHVKGVTPVGYNGMYRVASVSGNTFVLALNRTGLLPGTAFGAVTHKHAGSRGMITMLNCKSEADNVTSPCILAETNQQLTVIGLSSRATGSSGTEPMIRWDGPKVDDTGSALMVPPVTVIGSHGQSRAKLLVADRFGPDNGTFEIINSASGAGRACILNYLPGFTYAPVLDFVSIGTPPSPEVNNKRVFLDSATGRLSVKNSVGRVISLEMLPVVTSAVAPTTAQLPADKDTAIHKNTATGEVRLAYNDSGAIKSTVLS